MKKVLSIFMSMLFVLSSIVFSVNAQEENVYEESRIEIDLSCLNVSVVDGENFEYTARTGLLKKINTLWAICHKLLQCITT